MENLRQANKEAKDFKDKQEKTQEYVQKLTQDRNNKLKEVETLQRKNREMDNIIKNFAQIQEQLLHQKTKKRETVDLEFLAETLKEIKIHKNNPQKTISVLLSPRGGHVTVTINEDEETVAQQMFQVRRNELYDLEGIEDQNRFEEAKSDKEVKRVQLRPFDFHSNNTSLNVSRRGSFAKANHEIEENQSNGGLSINVSRSNSQISRRPPKINTSFLHSSRKPSAILEQQLENVQDLNHSAQIELYNQDYSQPGSQGNNSIIDALEAQQQTQPRHAFQMFQPTILDELQSSFTKSQYHEPSVKTPMWKTFKFNDDLLTKNEDSSDSGFLFDNSHNESTQQKQMMENSGGKRISVQSFNQGFMNEVATQTKWTMNDVGCQVNEASDYILTQQTTEEEKESHRLGNKVALRMDLLLDEEDLVIKSPIIGRRNTAMNRGNKESIQDKMPKKRLKNLAELQSVNQGIIGTNNRGSPQECCQPNCRIY